MLQQTLGTDFTEMNWTSELRGQVPGFSPYNGPSVADFCYADLKGILTNLWCGKELKQAWKLKGRWPTYHLEVKTTSGVANEPFHMSAAQLNTVRTCIHRHIVYQVTVVFVGAKVQQSCTGRSTSPRYLRDHTCFGGQEYAAQAPCLHRPTQGYVRRRAGDHMRGRCGSPSLSSHMGQNGCTCRMRRCALCN